MGEFDVLHHIYAASGDLGPNVIVPPGDDMAVVAFSAKQMLVAVDQLVDGRHVDLARTPLKLVGRKAITRSLSDIAAMAARPVVTLAAATLPQSFSDAQACALADAMRETAATYGAPLVGGDLAHHVGDGPLTCSVTVIAMPGPIGPVTRRGAQAGDGLYVTGAIGGSLDDDGGGYHLTFEPRIDVGLWLARIVGERLHAMIDISDGLGRDCGHLAQDSGVIIEVEASAIPCRAGRAVEQAIADGEDYELLFTAAGEVPIVAADGTPITRIGTARATTPEEEPGAMMSVNGVMQRIDEHGWEHRAT
ncbi:MAG: thiamine-phosphate kinase [Planctomycetota bacterium]